MCRVANGNDALEIPLSEDIFLQRHQDRRYLLIQELLEFQSRGDVVVLSPREQQLLVFFRVGGNVVAEDSLRQLKKVEPVDTTCRAAVDDIGFFLLEHRVRRAGLDALARLGDSEDASGVARDG